MSAVTKLEPQRVAARLVLTVAGVLLMIAPPYAVDLLNLSSRFQTATITVMELVFLIVGLVLLYLGLREPKPTIRES
mgnify:CR=1 FL=1